MGAPLDGDEVNRLAATYRRLAEQWDDRQGDARAANPLFERCHEVAKQLRQSPAGRRAIETEFAHPRIGVRLLAASDALAWRSEPAIPVLEQIASGVGLHAVSATWTLKSFREGTLNLDW